MSLLDRLDPEQIPALDTINNDLVDMADLPATRARLKQQLIIDKAALVPVEGIKITDRQISGATGDPDVTIRIYQPENRTEILPGLLYIHGGGYVLGSVDDADALLSTWAKEINCVIVSVEYRLAPEHPFPAPLEDCYASLKWFAENTEALGVDVSRIAISGGSAGGGLAAGLALLARDRGEVSICFQLLLYPMLDDRIQTPSSQDLEIPGWTVQHNRIGWASYLGKADIEVSPYAAPARAIDLSGLPPAYIMVGELDLFLDEDIEYAQRLLQAGVPTELHVFPGSVHAFELLIPEASVSRRAQAEQIFVLKKALHI